MALEESGNGLVMPVSPMGGYGYGNGGFFGDGSWIILFIIAMMFGGFGGGWGMNGFGGMNYDFPWLLNGQSAINANTNAGFDHAATQSAISALQSSVIGGFGDVQLGLAGVNQQICQTGNGIVSQMYNNEIASLDRSFAEQTANTQGFSNLQAQLAQCCCQNQLQSVETRNTIVSEAAANRAAGTANTQAILDKMCQLELDGYKRENDNLRHQLNMASLAASQADQTAKLIADNTAQTQYVVNRIAPYPIPAYTVNNPLGCNNFGYGIA